MNGNITLALWVHVVFMVYLYFKLFFLLLLLLLLLFSFLCAVGNCLAR